MRGLTVARNKFGFILVAAVAAMVFAAGFSVDNAAAQKGSAIGATICAGASTITLDTPISDSLVTDAAVEITGSLTQASQVEVTIDGQYDSIIQLAIGQKTYEGTVQLTPGTHTIGVRAVNICPGTSGTASGVVTYEPAPYEPSAGGDTGTNVEGDQSSGGVSSGDGVLIDEGNSGPSLLDDMLVPVQNFAQWLNIATGDVSGEQRLATMSLARAITFTIGLYLLIIGIAPSLFQAMAGWRITEAIVPTRTKKARVHFLTVGGRVLGALLILGSLFLP